MTVRQELFEEVGKEFQVTRERIRQIEAKAIRKLVSQAEARSYRITLIDNLSNRLKNRSQSCTESIQSL